MFGKTRTIKGQYKKLTLPYGKTSVWNLSFTGGRKIGKQMWVSLNVYNGDYEKNIEAVQNIQRVAPFPEAIKLYKGFREYAPEMRTLTLVIDSQ